MPSLRKRSALSLVLALLAVACGGSEHHAAPPPAAAPAPPPAPPASEAAAPAPAPAPAAAEPAREAAPAEPAHRHHGLAALLDASMASVDLRPDQKATVEQIEDRIDELSEQPKEAHNELSSAIADGVAVGKIDKKKTDASIKRLEDAAKANEPGMQEAVSRLHDTLDAAQRKKLVETMRAKGEEMHSRMKEHLAHEEDEKHEEHESAAEEREEHEHMHGGMWGKEQFDKFADEIGLTPEQREKLRAKMKAEFAANKAKMKTRMETMHQQMKAIGDAFEKDTFDAKRVGVGKMGPEMVREMATMHVKMAETVLSVLTPEQRPKFAEHIRAHADKGDRD